MTRDDLISKCIKDVGFMDNQMINPIVIDENRKINIQAVSHTGDLKNLWEVDSHLMCPLIGGCLTIEEHRRVLNKAGCSTKRKRPYQLHNMIMSHLNEKNRISLKVDNYLKYKYRKEVPALKDISEKEFMNICNDSLQSGNIEAIYYMAAVRNGLSSTAIEQIFGDVHMINHINLNEVSKVKMQLTMYEKTNIKLAGLFQEQKKKNISMKKEVSKLKGSIADLDNLNRVLKKRASSNNKEENEILRLRTSKYELNKRINQLEEKITRLSNENRKLERQKRKLEIKTYDLKSLNHQLNCDLRDLHNKSSLADNEDICSSVCPASKFCPGRILVVGGRTRMKQRYKNLIESHGGEFEYHDGCVKGGRQDLENRVKRCDMVLCTVNCNSHGACESVKKYCQRHGKSFKMLPSSSLSSILIAMKEGAGKN